MPPKQGRKADDKSMIETFASDTRPMWADTGTIKKYPQQEGDVAVDVCVIGAGITGLTTADLLKREGKSVAVIDLGRVGSGESSHTTGHVTEVLDIGFRKLISHFGLEGAQLACQSMRRSIERIEENIRRHGIACDFHRLSAFLFTENRDQIDEIEAESDAAIRLGVPNQLSYETPLPFSSVRAMRIDHQAQFNPLPYLAGLAATIPGNGSYLFEETRMREVVDGEPCRVITDRGVIVADEIVVAANVPSLNRVMLHSKIAPYRTYACALVVLDNFDDKHLFWDNARPYHYIRSYEHNGVRYVIVGGEDHKTGHEDHTGAAFKRLEEWARDRFKVDRVAYKWSGQIIEPADGLPYIGRNPLSDHVFVATGYSGTGMTLGTVAGMLISDLIIGNQNPWAELYDAGRVNPLAAAKAFLTENIDYPSHLISDRITPATQSDMGHIRENQGAIVRTAGKKVAAYRDPGGELHVMSPVCPHLGCHVNWNEAEKSWDCPCHGSRFSPTGKLLNGPAVLDLASETYDENIPLTPERYEITPSPDPFAPPLFSLFTCPLDKKT
jgi:glycine/D-amino acid oxidase-like deaminating enzyme/nitrite reductase/ring-hydroxylating ferredoxin subunit